MGFSPSLYHPGLRAWFATHSLAAIPSHQDPHVSCVWDFWTGSGTIESNLVFSFFLSPRRHIRPHSQSYRGPLINLTRWSCLIEIYSPYSPFQLFPCPLSLFCSNTSFRLSLQKALQVPPPPPITILLCANFQGPPQAMVKLPNLTPPIEFLFSK